MKWIDEAKKYVGEREVKGKAHNPLILQWWKDIKRGGIKDDETPWCAAFVGGVLERTGIKSTRFESAKSYLGWGEPLNKPIPGCVVVFSRDGGGHVGFVMGQTRKGELVVLGGNQEDAVNYKAFGRLRVIGFRWPVGEPKPADLNLQYMDAEGSVSES